MHYLYFIIALLLAGPASAQTTYSEWSNPDSSGANPQTQQLIDRLNKLIDEAEKARAADPAFLRDLRDLTLAPVTATVTAKPQIVLNDDFGDGDFSANPVWNISAGKYWIEQGWGLRSAVTQQAETPQAQQQTIKEKNRNAALAILGAVLNQSTSNNSVANTASAPTQPSSAVISTEAPIANAFVMEFDIYSSQPLGRLDIGPYQGTNLVSGYRLSYTPGGAMQIISSSARGINVVAESQAAISLEDKQTHTIRWTRDGAGRMNISIDGSAVIEGADRSFADPFQGLAIDNQGGDYIIRRIAVNGAS